MKIKLNRLNLSKVIPLIVLFLFVFSNFFLTGIMSISPFYFGFALFIFLSFCTISIDYKKIQFKKKYISPFYFLIVIFATYLFINTFVNKSSIKYISLLSCSLLYFLFAVTFLQNLSLNQIKNISKIYLFTSFALYACDLIYRILHPMHFRWTTAATKFYEYKFNSLMFTDTNEVAFAIMATFAFAFYLHNEKVINIPKSVLLGFFILLVGTFSRAAIFAALCLIFFYIFFLKTRLTVRVLLCCLLPLAILAIFSLFSKDASFGTKVDIIERCISYLKTVDFIHLLFGVGINNSIQALGGIYGHNFLVLYLIEFGLVGFISLITLFIFFIYLKKNLFT